MQCFFFSSRRRHTRLQGDWSSDVCSSDLVGAELAQHAPTEPESGPGPGRLGRVDPLGYPEARVGLDERDAAHLAEGAIEPVEDRKSTRLNSSHLVISYAVFC